MTVTRSVALMLVAAAATVGGVVVWHVTSPWREPLGPKVYRECVSLVETVMAQGPVLSPGELILELQRLGVTVPSTPDAASVGLSDEQLAKANLALLQGKRTPPLERYEAAQRAHDVRWEEIKRSPEYQAARDTTLKRKRDRFIRECVLTRAKREGVPL